MKAEIKNQYIPLFGDAEAEAVYAYMKSGGWITEYKKTEEFEQEIAKFLGMPYCSAVNNGTISLVIALLAVGVKPGHKVLVPDMTMIATANAVKLIGAIPVFVEIDLGTQCMMLSQARSFLQDNRASAVIYVTFNGNAERSVERYTDFIKECREIGTAVIEDSAQSLGSQYSDGTWIGTKADITSFSFSVPKIISTGQGGCLVTNDKELYNKVEKIKDFGRVAGGIDIHDTFGINAKFTEVQAVIGLEQLKTISWRIQRKKEIYDRYRQNLFGMKTGFFYNLETKKRTPWFVDFMASGVGHPEIRIKLMEFLKANEIGYRAVYPVVSSQKAWDGCVIGRQKTYNADYYSKNCLWLPSSFNLTNEDIDYVCDKIREFYGIR